MFLLVSKARVSNAVIAVGATSELGSHQFIAIGLEVMESPWIGYRPTESKNSYLKRQHDVR
jgi:hypothetical protein